MLYKDKEKREKARHFLSPRSNRRVGSLLSTDTFDSSSGFPGRPSGECLSSAIAGCLFGDEEVEVQVQGERKGKTMPIEKR